MSEEKKEHGDGCCGTPAAASGSGCGCGKGCGCGGGPKKFICGLIIGAFIFAAGMWYAKASCTSNGGGCQKSSAGMNKTCPVGSNTGGGMMGSK